MELIICNDKVLKAVNTDLYSGYEQARDITLKKEDKPKFTWKGGKMPFALWVQIVSFLRWSQETFKEEAMVTLFYNIKDRTWAAWPFPQEPCGMTIKLLPEHPQYAADRAQFGNGWIQCGSVHHHCDSSAFQSGTDTADEQDRDGVHITLGKMRENALDIHIRQIFDSIQGETSSLDWIDVPTYLRDVPLYMLYDFTIFAIKAVRLEAFPEEWKSRIVERVRPSFPNGTHHHTPAPAMSPTTLLTRQTAGNTPTESNKLGKKARREARQQAHLALVTANAPTSDYEVQSIQRIQDVCTLLGMTLEEAKVLLDADAFSLPDIERINRNELCTALIKGGVPQLFAARLLRNLFA